MPASEQAVIPAIAKSQAVRQENPFRLGSSKGSSRENQSHRPEKQSRYNFTPLPDHILSARDRISLWIAEKRQQNVQKHGDPPTPQHSKETKDQLPSNPRSHLSTIAGLSHHDHMSVRRHIALKPLQTEVQFTPSRQLNSSLLEKLSLRKHTQPKRETHGIFEKTPPKIPISVKSAEALIAKASEVRAREPIPKDEFKTLHPSEHFFSKIPKLKEIPHTNEQISGSVPESKIVAEKNMATPYEVYSVNTLRGKKLVIRKLDPQALPIKLIKENGEAQEVKADNGRDVTKTLAFQIKEAGKNKFYQLRQTDDLVMRFVEITDKRQIAKVIARKHEYARKNGYLPDRNKLRQNPGMEIRADQKKRDHFYTWHDILDKISVKSIQTLGKAHIVCDKSLPSEKASLFSKKFIEAYYSKKYDGLSIKERTKQIFADILKELGLENEQSVATYLVTHEDKAYAGGKGAANVTASYGNTQDNIEPPSVFQGEQNTFQNQTFDIGGRTLTLVDDSPTQTAPTELSPDNGITITIQPESD